MQNIGTQTILSSTNYKNLINDTLKIRITNIKKFKKIQLMNDFPIDEFIPTDTGIEVKFKQWMTGDFLDIVYFFEPIDEERTVDMFINKHQLINGNIKYSMDLFDKKAIWIMPEDSKSK